MNKKILSIFSIILLLFIGFFINVNKVKAEDIYDCKYYSPLSFIDSSNRAANIYVKMHYPRTTDPGWLADYQIDDFIFQQKSIKGFCIVSSSFSPGFQLDSPVVDTSLIAKSRYHDFYQSIFKISTNGDVKTRISGNENYVKLYFDENEDSLILVESSEDEYKKYLENQYKSLETDATHYQLYDFVTWEYGPTYNNSDDQKLYSETWINIPYYKYMSDVGFYNDTDYFFNYIKGVGGIVYVNPSYAPKYPNKNYGLFDEMLHGQYYNCDANGNNCKYLDEKEIEKVITGMEMVIDTSEVDTRARSSKFYEATKNRWETYMAGDLKDPIGASTTRKTYFKTWFDMVKRYIFEEDENMSKFETYLKYIYYNKDVVGELTEDVYNRIVDIIDNMNIYRNAKKKLEELDNNACLAICANGNECIARGLDGLYSTCTKCYNQCSTASSGKSTCLESCMGNDYDKISKMIIDAKSQAENDKINSAQSAIGAALELRTFALKLISAPTLDIDFGDGEPINCKNISFLHTIYMIIIIIAPILVIILGSLDFFKAMLQSDEEKMKKFKKAFPKRLIMLVLLILVPVIISFLVGKIDALNDTLMRCIVNG